VVTDPAFLSGQRQQQEQADHGYADHEHAPINGIKLEESAPSSPPCGRIL
jgi:hypothetical protein